MLYVMDILRESIVDGEGIRSVLFVAGCTHKCEGCHNPTSWDINNGKAMSVDEVYEELTSSHYTDITLSGGEVFSQAKEILQLLVNIKTRTNKNVWVYTGYKFEDLLNGTISREILNYVDVLIDGPFILAQKDLSLLYKGSSNQRIINVQDSLSENTVVLWGN